MLLKKIDGNMKWVGVIWVLSGFGWFTLSLLVAKQQAEYNQSLINSATKTAENYNIIIETIRILLDKRDYITNTKIVTVLAYVDKIAEKINIDKSELLSLSDKNILQIISDDQTAKHEVATIMPTKE
jgi:hypothetical protein